MEQKCWFGIFNRTRCRVDCFFFAFFLFSKGCRALSLEFGPSVTVILLHLLILLNWNVRFIVRDHFVARSTRRCFDPSDKLHDIGELCSAFWCMEFANCRIKFWLLNCWIVVGRLLVYRHIVFFLRMNLILLFRLQHVVWWEFVFCRRTRGWILDSGHKIWNKKLICLFR